jgi:cholest-4-en-3-one 26-monooxygenase
MNKIDIASAEIYTRGVPHDLYAQLRREAPVYWHEEPDGPGFWAVTKHRDVLDVSRDAATFSSEVAGTQIMDLPRTDPRGSPDNLANMDPPRHSQYRALINQSFTPQGLKQVEEFVRESVTQLIDGAIAKGRFDFMGDFASRLPMGIILRMVGVPTEDQGQLARWVGRLLVPDDPDYAATDAERAETWMQFMGYAHKLAAERRGTPQDDLLSRLMAAEVDGQRLTYDEFGMFFILLIAAGTHTTSLSLGSGILTLIQHPDQKKKLVEDPSRIDGAIDEMLRFNPPLLHFRRTATRDTEIRGRAIKKGQKVVVWYAAANRDEEVFADPDRFDIERTPNDHIAFGYGPHFCLGQALARMQLRIGLGECVRRMPDLKVDGEIERVRSSWFNGMKRLPLDCRAPGA